MGEELLEMVRAKVLERGPHGIKYIGRLFRIMDDNGNKQLDYGEFKTGLDDCGLELADDQKDELCKAFDMNGDGNIGIEEFLFQLRPPLSQLRKNLIEQAWATIDVNGDGVLTVEDIKGKFDPRRHPKYLAGEWTEEQVFMEFLKSFDSPGEPDGKVTFEEWVNYYTGVSNSIDNDIYFDLMMRQAWKL